MFKPRLKPEAVNLRKFWPIVTQGMLRHTMLVFQTLVTGPVRAGNSYTVRWMPSKTGYEFHVEGTEEGKDFDRQVLRLLPRKLARSSQIKTVIVRTLPYDERLLQPLPIKNIALQSVHFLSDPAMHNNCPFTVKFQFKQGDNPVSTCFLEYGENENWTFVIAATEDVDDDYVAQALETILAQWFDAFVIDDYEKAD